VRGIVSQDYNNNDFSLAGRDLLQDDRLAQLQHEVDLFKELGVNTLHVCRSGNGSAIIYGAC
jgi:hypothetical protein